MSIFCDWITIYQTHASIPMLNDGHWVEITADGNITKKRDKKLSIKGSFDTSIQVRSDGNTFWLSGNVGRFGRPDNLFGYSVARCIEIASDIAEDLGMPRFSVAKPHYDAKTDQYEYNGAIIAGLHLTQNYVVQACDVSKVLDTWYGWKLPHQQHASERYQKPGMNSVTWNEGSRRWYAKAYDATLDKGIFPNDDESLHFLRLEKELFPMYLKDRALHQLDAWIDRETTAYVSPKWQSVQSIEQTGLQPPYSLLEGVQRMSKVADIIEFNAFANGLLHRSETTRKPTDIINSLPTRLRAYARNYLDGHDLKHDLPHNTFYRVRKALLAHGLDIGVSLNISRLPYRIETIQIQPAQAPAQFDRTRPHLRIVKATADASNNLLFVANEEAA